MSIGLWWSVLHYDGGVWCEEGGLVDEGFCPLRDYFEVVVREWWWEGVERSRSCWCGWRLDWRDGFWLGHGRVCLSSGSAIEGI